MHTYTYVYMYMYMYRYLFLYLYRYIYNRYDSVHLNNEKLLLFCNNAQWLG